MSLVDSSIVIRKRDPDEHERRVGMLEDALASGSHLSTAAAYAGMSARTLDRWVKEGRRLREILEAVEQDPDDDREASPAEWELIWLADKVDQAEAKAEVGLVGMIHQTAHGVTVDEDGERVNIGLDATGFRSAAFLLERRFKDRWAQRQESTGKDGGAVEVRDLTMQRENVEKAIEKVAERLAGRRRLGTGDEVEVEVLDDDEDQES